MFQVLCKVILPFKNCGKVMNQKYTVLDVNSIEQGFFFSTLSVQENSV